MKAELKAKWVAALRSGDYKQATGRLKAFIGGPMGTDSYSGDALDAVPADTPIGYCCLGVLCNIVDPNGWHHGETTIEDEDGGETAVEAADWEHPKGQDGELLNLDSDGESEWVTLTLEDEYYDEDGGSAVLGDLGGVQDMLANLNDTGADFNTIADWIEAHVKVTA